jgi:hypothetical protein
MKSFHWLFALQVAALALLSSSAAFAARPSPCAEDVKKLCADVKPGGGAMAQCLDKHEGELSEACKGHRDAARERGKGFMKDCGEDVKKNCKDMKPGHGQIYACLKKNEATLSDACKAQLNPKK